jgi:hypothetical protein
LNQRSESLAFSAGVTFHAAYNPTTSGFCIVPGIYSGALNEHYYCAALETTDYSHVVVRMNIGRIEVLYRLTVL